MIGKLILAALCCVLLLALGVSTWAVGGLVVASFLFGFAQGAVRDFRGRSR